jgi:hypothetical protein
LLFSFGACHWPWFWVQIEYSQWVNVYIIYIYIYNQNTTILLRSGTVCINNCMFRPLYWPSSVLCST